MDQAESEGTLPNPCRHLFHVFVGQLPLRTVPIDMVVSKVTISIKSVIVSSCHYDLLWFLALVFDKDMYELLGSPRVLGQRLGAPVQAFHEFAREAFQALPLNEKANNRPRHGFLSICSDGGWGFGVNPIDGCARPKIPLTGQQLRTHSHGTFSALVMGHPTFGVATL
jgi:hypothetical protein